MRCVHSVAGGRDCGGFPTPIEGFRSRGFARPPWLRFAERGAERGASPHAGRGADCGAFSRAVLPQPFPPGSKRHKHSISHPAAILCLVSLVPVGYLVFLALAALLAAVVDQAALASMAVGTLTSDAFDHLLKLCSVVCGSARRPQLLPAIRTAGRACRRPRMAASTFTKFGCTGGALCHLCLSWVWTFHFPSCACVGFFPCVVPANVGHPFQFLPGWFSLTVSASGWTVLRSSVCRSLISPATVASFRRWLHLVCRSASCFLGSVVWCLQCRMASPPPTSGPSVFSLGDGPS